MRIVKKVDDQLEGGYQLKDTGEATVGVWYSWNRSNAFKTVDLLWASSIST